MKRLTLATLTTLSMSAFAQPTYITQIQENETWVKGGYGTVTTDYDFTRKSDQLEGSASSEVDGYNVTVLKMMNGSAGVTPGLMVSASTLDNDGTDVTTIEVAGVARLNLGTMPAALSLSYTSNSKSEYRDSISLSVDVASSSQDTSFYNEVSVDYQSFIEGDGVSGANPISIMNTSNFKLTPKVDAVTRIGISVTSDASIDGVKAIEYGNELTFGVGLNLHISPVNTIQVSLAKSNAVNDVYVDGEVVESDESDTTIVLSLIGRF